MKQNEQKHNAIIDAATRVFLGHGFLATNMEQIAKEAKVSKQTIYKHWPSKEALFLSIISDLTSRADNQSQLRLPSLAGVIDVASYLEEYAFSELETLMSSEVIKLRRLVIGEAERFPEVARSYYENGPMKGFRTIEQILCNFVDKGLIEIVDKKRAAEDLNWLILAHPFNKAMFLGQTGVPSQIENREHARRVVRFFLQAFSCK